MNSTFSSSNLFAKDTLFIVVDFSAWLYITILGAFNTWKRNYRDEYNYLIKPEDETDQHNLPNLIVSSNTFKGVLKQTVMKNLEKINFITERNCPDLIDTSDNFIIVFAEDDYAVNNFRRKLFPEYKLNRKFLKKSWDFFSARNYVTDILLGNELQEKYVKISCPGAEADDIIATLFTKTLKNNNAILLSSDHDFCQLENVRQYDLFGNEVKFWIDKKKNISVTGKDVVFVKSLSGDKSDNIPNIAPRVGIKTAYDYKYKNKDKLKSFLVSNNKKPLYQFVLNAKLIDFNLIPEELTKQINDISTEKIMQYCSTLNRKDNIAKYMMVI